MKKSVPFTLVRFANAPVKNPCLMSTVPAPVPSLLQSWLPFKTVKNSVPLTLVRFEGEAEPLPGMMSLTSTVPSGVPSLFQSSVPVVPR